MPKNIKVISSYDNINSYSLAKLSDVVIVYAVVEGWKKEGLAREEYYRSFHPIEVDGKKWRAISWTTAASLAAVVEMVADGKLPQQGFIKQEDIDFNAFLETQTGSYFKA